MHDAGYVRTSRTGRGPDSEIWVTMTRRGMKAYEAHATARREVFEGTLLASSTDAV